MVGTGAKIFQKLSWEHGIRIIRAQALMGLGARKTRKKGLQDQKYVGFMVGISIHWD